MHLLENGPLPDSGSRDRNLACLAQLTCKNLLSIAALKQTYQSSPQRPNTERSWMMVQSFDSPAVLTSSVGLVITFPEALWLDLVRGPDRFIYMVYYDDRHSYVESYLHLWDEAYLIMVEKFLMGSW
ncbi:hypothetical protein STEG23_005829, partial [Scotinomys teguina]